MRGFPAFLLFCAGQPHWCPAVDLVNTCLQKTAAKIRHTLITLRQLVAFHDPVDTQGYDS